MPLKRVSYKRWKTDTNVPIPKRTLARLKKAEKQRNLCVTTSMAPVDLCDAVSVTTDQTVTEYVDTDNDETLVQYSQQLAMQSVATDETRENHARDDFAQIEDGSNASDTEFICESDISDTESGDDSDDSSGEEMVLENYLDNMSDFIYPGASITTEDSILSIMKFSIRHKCTYTATTDLIALVSLHLPPNSKKDHLKSLYFLKKAFSAKEQSDETVTVKEYCPGCYAPLRNDFTTCEFCGKARSKRDKNYFLSLDIREQIKAMFKGM